LKASASNRAEKVATAVGTALTGALVNVPTSVLASVSGNKPIGGEGTGQPLGANEPIFVIVIFTVFTIVWVSTSLVTQRSLLSLELCAL
jgi:hypothetical protein